jgi:hypothetical protein
MMYLCQIVRWSQPFWGLGSQRCLERHIPSGWDEETISLQDEGFFRAQFLASFCPTQQSTVLVYDEPSKGHGHCCIVP